MSGDETDLTSAEVEEQWREADPGFPSGADLANWLRRQLIGTQSAQWAGMMSACADYIDDVRDEQIQNARLYSALAAELRAKLASERALADQLAEAIGMKDDAPAALRLETERAKTKAIKAALAAWRDAREQQRAKDRSR